MAERVVPSFRVGHVLHSFVDDEVNALEGHVHNNLRAVRPVEGREALAPVHLNGAVRHRPERTVVHLQTLLHHCVSHQNVQ